MLGSVKVVGAFCFHHRFREVFRHHNQSLLCVCCRDRVILSRWEEPRVKSNDRLSFLAFFSWIERCDPTKRVTHQHNIVSELGILPVITKNFENPRWSDFLNKSTNFLGADFAAKITSPVVIHFVFVVPAWNWWVISRPIIMSQSDDTVAARGHLHGQSWVVSSVGWKTVWEHNRLHLLQAKFCILKHRHFNGLQGL